MQKTFLQTNKTAFNKFHLYFCFDHAANIFYISQELAQTETEMNQNNTHKRLNKKINFCI